MLYERNGIYNLSRYILDIGTTVFALVLAEVLALPRIGKFELPMTVLLLIIHVWTLVFVILSVYDLRQRKSLFSEAQGIIAAVTLSLLIFCGLLYFSYREMPRTFFAYFYFIDLGLLLGWRLVFRLAFRLLSQQNNLPKRRVIILGDGEAATKTAEIIRQYDWLGFELVGFLSDQSTYAFGDVKTIGRLDQTLQIVVEKQIDEVVIALPYSAYDHIDNIVASLQSMPVQVRLVPNYLSLALYRASAESIAGLTLINLKEPAISLNQRSVKRVFDLVLATLALVLTAPLLLVTAAAIKLDSPGPVIFRQRRIGEQGRSFMMYKFRSMYIDAEERLKEVMVFDAEGRPIHKIPNDPRVTRIGRIIRSTSIDELPQLLNVIKGDMSLVGPRPELPWLVETYAPWQHKRLAVPQGITGWWQVNGRSSKLMHLNTEEDLYYIQNYSLLLDIQILWKTIAAVVKRVGAY